VAVSVALAVGAPGFVAALVSRNDIVKVIDAVRRSRIDELREHGRDALEQVDAALVQLARDQLIELRDIEVRSTFHRRASGDRVVQHASDIGRYRRRLPPRLRALITATTSFPLTSAATNPGATTATATAFHTGLIARS
jgi:hypothetical protein